MMKNTIYAKSVFQSILDEVNNNNEVHSVFEKGINIKGKTKLIFIGRDTLGEVPFGIHLLEKDFLKLQDISPGENFLFNSGSKSFEVRDTIIYLKEAKYFSSKLPHKRFSISDSSLSLLLKETIEQELMTGLDMRLIDLISKHNSFGSQLKRALSSQDNNFIDKTLRKTIGRGSGLTPSGDDILLGLLWLNDIRSFISDVFICTFKALVTEDGLTTDISKNYYIGALCGDYSHLLIALTQALIGEDAEEIKNHILRILEYGHTSGADTLAGIALGIVLILNQ